MQGTRLILGAPGSLRVWYSLAPLSVIPEFIAQRPHGNAQEIGGVRPIPLRASQGLENKLALNSR